MPRWHNTKSGSPRSGVIARGGLRVLFALLLLLPTLVLAQATSLDDAVQQAQRKVPGKLVAASEETRDGRVVYRIRILAADGVVRTVIIESATR